MIIVTNVDLNNFSLLHKRQKKLGLMLYLVSNRKRFHHIELVAEKPEV